MTSRFARSLKSEFTYVTKNILLYEKNGFPENSLNFSQPEKTIFPIQRLEIRQTMYNFVDSSLCLTDLPTYRKVKFFSLRLKRFSIVNELSTELVDK